MAPEGETSKRTIMSSRAQQQHRRRRSSARQRPQQSLAECIVSGEQVLFITGAGISVASGIPPFRSGRSNSMSKKTSSSSVPAATASKSNKTKKKEKKDGGRTSTSEQAKETESSSNSSSTTTSTTIGIWNSTLYTQATKEAVRENPLRWWNDFWLCWLHMSDPSYFQPNDAHMALAQLMKAFPSNTRLITQNIDGLHHRASAMAAAAMIATDATTAVHPKEEKNHPNNKEASFSSFSSSHIIEAHGRMGLYRCLPEYNDSSDDEEDDNADDVEQDESSFQSSSDDEEARPVRLGHKRIASMKRACPYQYQLSLTTNDLSPLSVRHELMGRRSSHDNGEGGVSSDGSSKARTNGASKQQQEVPGINNTTKGNEGHRGSDSLVKTATAAASDDDNDSVAKRTTNNGERAGRHHHFNDDELPELDDDMPLSTWQMFKSDKKRKKKESKRDNGDTIVVVKKNGMGLPLCQIAELPKCPYCHSNNNRSNNGRSTGNTGEKQPSTCTIAPTVASSQIGKENTDGAVNNNEYNENENVIQEQTNVRDNNNNNNNSKSRRQNSVIIPQALLFDEGYHAHAHFQFQRMERWIRDATVIVFCGTSFAVQITQVALDHARHASNHRRQRRRRPPSRQLHPQLSATTTLEQTEQQQQQEEGSKRKRRRVTAQYATAYVRQDSVSSSSNRRSSSSSSRHQYDEEDSQPIRVFNYNTTDFLEPSSLLNVENIVGPAQETIPILWEKVQALM